jgi:solute:Na+ symporter, SSS family
MPLVLAQVTDTPGSLGGHFVNLNLTLAFPLILAISLVGCLTGTLLSKPEEDAVLVDFYRRVRPWGLWGPILKKVTAKEPDFIRNQDFLRDMFNVAVGIIWQISQVALPLYIVLRESRRAILTLAVLLATSAILKFSWYDHLAVREVETDKAAAGEA